MERLKSIVLGVLVLLSIFLSYELLFKDQVKENEAIKIDDKNVISYKRFYSTNPNKELLDEIPSDELSNFVARVISNSKSFRNEDGDVFDFKKLGESKDNTPLSHRGYLAISGFEIPLKLLNLSADSRIGDVPFESFDKFFIDNSEKRLYINTNIGVKSAEFDDEFHTTEFKNAVLFDEFFVPESTKGVNAFSVVQNPISSFSKKDRQSFAEKFLGTKNIYEINERYSYIYSSETASIEIKKNGDIVYLRSPGPEKMNSNLFDSLVAFKNFIKTSLLSFSDYRILSLENIENNGFKIVFCQGKLPHYLKDGEFYEAEIKNNRITYFKYNSVTVKAYMEVSRKPEIGTYKAAFLKDEDAFFMYNGQNTGNINVVELR